MYVREACNAWSSQEMETHLIKELVRMEYGHVETMDRTGDREEFVFFLCSTGVVEYMPFSSKSLSSVHQEG